MFNKGDLVKYTSWTNIGPGGMPLPTDYGLGVILSTQPPREKYDDPNVVDCVVYFFRLKDTHLVLCSGLKKVNK